MHDRFRPKAIMHPPGMSVANRAVDAMMGPRQTEVVHRNEVPVLCHANPTTWLENSNL